MLAGTKAIVWGIGGLVCSIGVLIFWAIFFKLAPFLSNAIPAGDWHNFLSIVIYVLVGWFGGISIPLLFVILGISFIIHMFND